MRATISLDTAISTLDPFKGLWQTSQKSKAGVIETSCQEGGTDNAHSSYLFRNLLLLLWNKTCQNVHLFTKSHCKDCMCVFPARFSKVHRPSEWWPRNRVTMNVINHSVGAHLCNRLYLSSYFACGMTCWILAYIHPEILTSLTPEERNQNKPTLSDSAPPTPTIHVLPVSIRKWTTKYILFSILTNIKYTAPAQWWNWSYCYFR